MANQLRKAQKPLAGSAISPTGLSFNGVDLTSPGPVQAPQIPGMSGSIASSIQNAQNQANANNVQRYTQGLGVLTGGYNNALGSIQGAIDSSNLYGTTAKQQLGLQYQQALGQQAQSAVSRGLANTTIADTMKDLPTRQYNDAINQVTEQQANRASGLLLDQGNMQGQAGNSIANYIASRNDQGPNLSQYASLVQGASNRPNGGTFTMPGGGGRTSFGDPSPFPSDGSLPNTSGGANKAGGGGGGGYGGGGPAQFLGPGQAGSQGVTPPASPTQGYTGSSSSSGIPATDPTISNTMTNAGYAPGSISVGKGMPISSAAPTPISTAVQPQSQQIQAPISSPATSTPCPYYDAMQGLCNDGTNRTSNGVAGGVA